MSCQRFLPPEWKEHVRMDHLLAKIARDDEQVAEILTAEQKKKGKTTGRGVVKKPR